MDDDIKRVDELVFEDDQCKIVIGKECTCPYCCGKGEITMPCGNCHGTGKVRMGGSYTWKATGWVSIL